MPKVERRGSEWTVRISLTDPTTGKRTQRRLSARTKGQLDVLIAEARSQFARGDYVEPNDTPLAVWMEHWLSTYQRGGSSILARDVAIRSHIASDPIGSIPLGRLRLVHLQEYVDRKAQILAPSYVSSLVSILGMALRRAKRLKLIREVLVDELDVPASRRATWTVLSREDASRLIAETAGSEWGAFWTLAVMIGARRGELLALRWEDVDLRTGRITIGRTIRRDAAGAWFMGELTKSGGKRSFQLPARCVAALTEHRRRQLERRLSATHWVDSGAVFDMGNGEYWRQPSNVHHHWQRVRTQVGLPPMRVHDLRHTSATHMIQIGVPIPTVAHYLGHANPATTLRVYAHVLKEMEHEAAARIDVMYDVSEPDRTAIVPAGT